MKIADRAMIVIFTSSILTLNVHGAKFWFFYIGNLIVFGFLWFMLLKLEGDK